MCEAEACSNMYDEYTEEFNLNDWLEDKNLARLQRQKSKGKRFYIECDSRYNKGKSLYYQQNYGFSIYYDNRSLFSEEIAKKILSKMKFNNPRIVKE